MKKLLVLTLVLAIASLASATVSYTQVGDALPGGSFTIRVAGQSNADAPYEYGLYTSDGVIGSGLIDYVSTAIYDGVGEPLEAHLTSATQWSGYDGADLKAAENSITGIGDFNGSWFDVVFSVASDAIAGQVATVSVQYYGDSSYDETDTIDVAIIPEPATLALLGLGGLLLRRRK